MKNIKIIYSLLFLFSFTGMVAQALGIVWEKTYGGSQFDGAMDIINTLDGGYLISGYTLSNDGDVSVNFGGGDVWLLKIDVNGIIEWEKSYGGSSFDFGQKILQTNDDGYILVGTSDSSDGDVANNYGQSDVWIVKLSAAGNKIGRAHV